MRRPPGSSRCIDGGLISASATATTAGSRWLERAIAARAPADSAENIRRGRNRLPHRPRDHLMPEEKYTRCPGCATVFRVKPEQLALRDGQVRCGHCKTVVDGVAQP